MKEVWKDIPGYEGAYQVSDLGRVRSVDRDVWAIDPWGNRTKFRRKGKLLKLYLNKRDNRYSVTPGAAKKKILVARLVAITFLKNTNNLPDVDHINGCRTDDRLINLRWVSRQENLNNRHTPTGKLKILGVTKTNSNKKNPYIARRVRNKKVKHLGCFATANEASKAYIAERKKEVNV